MKTFDYFQNYTVIKAFHNEDVHKSTSKCFICYINYVIFDNKSVMLFTTLIILFSLLIDVIILH